MGLFAFGIRPPKAGRSVGLVLLIKTFCSSFKNCLLGNVGYFYTALLILLATIQLLSRAFTNALACKYCALE